MLVWKELVFDMLFLDNHCILLRILRTDSLGSVVGSFWVLMSGSLICNSFLFSFKDGDNIAFLQLSDVAPVLTIQFFDLSYGFMNSAYCQTPSFVSLQFLTCFDQLFI